MILEFAAGFLLSGFIALVGFNVSPSPQPTVEIEAVEPEISSIAAERLISSDDIDLTGMDIFWQSEDFFLEPDQSASPSKESAAVYIYVDAYKDEDGTFLFDDGQEWMLLMETSDGLYPLLPRQYVQLGEVMCDIFWDLDNTLHVLVSVKQSAGIKIYDCIYDGNAKEFTVENIYNEQGINRMSYSPQI